jgi:hypothetical protein
MPMQGLAAGINPGPGLGGPAGAGGIEQMFADPQATAKTLASMGIAPPTGVQAPGAVPGAQFTGGLSGAQGAPEPRAITGGNLGLGQLMGELLKQEPPRTLGALLRGA